jgi:phenylalanyl-tRNA synthetase beta chain
MRVSLNWLRDYIKTDLSAAEIAAILTDTGLEVEKVETFESVPGGLKGVVVGKVMEVSAHPDADRLRITKVDVGAGDLLQIVCGAPNVAAGQKVLVATVGTVLKADAAEPIKIKKSKIRGVESEGMICAEDELDLGTNHDGIMVLSDTAVVGDTAADYLGLYSDEVLEIGLTPNRTDAFGHFGVARDLAARLSLEFKVKAELPAVPSFAGKAANPINVKIEDADGCGRYAGITLEGVKIAPSPAWLQNRLKAIGLSPINNVVDITNFVLHETGQPLHAFDADRIAGATVIVRTMPEGTAFKTLDGVERKLFADDLMICNANAPMCIAGVFGGSESGVSSQTTRVFLESAWFNPSRIRKASRRHGLNTDASFRFERGVDPKATLYALRRAAQLVIDVCEAKVAGSEIDIVAREYSDVAIDFSLERCNSLCGTSMDDRTLRAILDSLDFVVLSEKAGLYRLISPSYRVDVTREVDVIEEVLRIFGFNEVSLPGRMSFSVSYPEKPSRHEIIHAIAQTLVGRGFTEMMANGLIRSEFLHDAAGAPFAENAVPILNPLSQELDVLRPSLIPGALEAVAYNLNRQTERIMLFETGTVYEKSGSSFPERKMLSIVLSGNRFAENWNNSAAPFDASDLTGCLAAVLDTMGLAFTTEAITAPMYADAMMVKVNGQHAGIIGPIDKIALKRYGIKQAVLIAELDLDVCLKQVKHASKTYGELPRAPWVRRDFSLLLDQVVKFEEIEKIAFKRGGKLLKEVSLFDVYEGKNLPAGKKSYAVRFILQDSSRTLNDQEIDRKMSDIQAGLEKELGATLR